MFCCQIITMIQEVTFMRLKTRLISILICCFLIFSNVNAMTAKAATLEEANASRLAGAISMTRYGSKINSSDYFNSLRSGNTIFIRSFSIVDLDEPVHGSLLDSTATVVADNGVNWEIPVIWVDRSGTLTRLAIKIGDSFNCYPIFVFYMPQAYSLMFGEDATYDISLPDFVNVLIRSNGVTTLSNPQRGITYITPLLPDKEQLVAVTPTGYYERTSDYWRLGLIPPADHGAAQDQDDTKSTVNPGPSPFVPPTPDPDNPPTPDPDVPTYQYQEYRLPEGMTEAEKAELVNLYCDDNALMLGNDNLAWLASFVKDVLEPEAVNLLLDKFPAYSAAEENGELGEKISLYIYYNESVGNDGTYSDFKDVVADISSYRDENQALMYRLGINAGQLYVLNTDTNTYSFEGEDAFTKLDATMVHELMHAMMEDYTRTGMQGVQYVSSTDEYKTYDGHTLRYPEWFVEGIATAVGSPYQYWNQVFHEYYGYDPETKSYSYSSLKNAYTENESMRLSYSDTYEADHSLDNSLCSYVTGYLANMYLGYLAAQKYDNEDAIYEIVDSDNIGHLTVDSSIISSGLNHILEMLHTGSTLDEVIGGLSVYEDTDDFINKFIVTSSGGDPDDGESLYFCIRLLNYLEDSSTDDKAANGSILLDLTDTSPVLLKKEQKKVVPTIYVISKNKDYEESTVENGTALQAGGTSMVGIVVELEESTSEEVITDVAASISPRLQKDAEAAGELGQEKKEGKNTDDPSELTLNNISDKDAKDSTQSALETKSDSENESTEKTDQSSDILSLDESLMACADSIADDILNAITGNDGTDADDRALANDDEAKKASTSDDDAVSDDTASADGIGTDRDITSGESTTSDGDVTSTGGAISDGGTASVDETDSDRVSSSDEDANSGDDSDSDSEKTSDINTSSEQNAAVEGDAAPENSAVPGDTADSVEDIVSGNDADPDNAAVPSDVTVTDDGLAFNVAPGTVSDAAENVTISENPADVTNTSSGEAKNSNSSDNAEEVTDNHMIFFSEPEPPTNDEPEDDSSSQQVLDVIQEDSSDEDDSNADSPAEPEPVTD